MPFEISDEGNFHSARLFGVLDRADLNAVMDGGSSGWRTKGRRRIG